jgi:hypothetical protein
MKKNPTVHFPILLALLTILVCLLYLFRNIKQNSLPAAPVVKKEKTVVLPKKLMTACSEKYFADSKTCGGEPATPVCFYYVKKIGTAGKKQQATYNNLCFGCYFFGKEGKRTFGNTEITLLGYEQGACKEEIFN